MSFRTILPTAVCVVMVTGCAGRAYVHRLHDQVDRLDHAVAAVSLKQSTSADPNQLQGDLKSLEEQLRVVEAKVAGLEAQFAQIDGRVDSIKREVGTTSAAVADLKRSAEKASAEYLGPVPTTAVVQPASLPREERVVRPAPEAERQYDAALALLKKGEHGEAVLEFLDFLTRYPTHRLAANAQYWIGQAYYDQHDFGQAALEFEKVLDHGAPNGKVADALLMIGLCRQRLHDGAGAGASWQRLLREYPKSDAAVKAQALLRASAHR